MTGYTVVLNVREESGAVVEWHYDMGYEPDDALEAIDMALHDADASDERVCGLERVERDSGWSG